MDPKQLEQLLLAMNKQQADQQQIMQALLSKLSTADSSGSSAATLASSLDNRIAKFLYDPESGATFEAWHKRYGNYIEVDGQSLDDSTKVRLLVGKLGETEYSKFADSILPDTPDKLDYATAIRKLKELFADSRSLVVRRFECLKMVQKQGQDISSYVAQVNAACEKAKMELKMEELKCLIMVVGLRDDHHDIRQKCLQLLEEARKRGSALTLEKLAEECRAFQLIRDSAQSLAKGSSINAIHAKPQQWKEKGNKKGKFSGNSKKPEHPKSTAPSRQMKPCDSCGGQNHLRKDCKFRNAKCHKCQKEGHIAKVCRSQQGAFKALENNVVTVSDMSCLATEFKSTDWFVVPVKVNGIDIEMKLDTAAQMGVFTSSTWAKLGKPEVNAKNCNGVNFELLGKFECSVQYNGNKSQQLVGYVSEHIVHDLLGIPWIVKLQILPPKLLHKFRQSKENSFISNVQNSAQMSDATSLSQSLQNTFPEVFNTDLGLCTKMKAHLHLKQDVRPTFCKARPVPFGATEAVNAELDRLLSIGSLKKVDYSQWAAPILAVKKKNGDTRVCIDFSTGLNNALELNRHPLPRPEDIYASLNGAKYFSQLDLRDAYLQIELDEESKQLCGVNTHRGLMQCQRLPFGVKSAPSIFQELIDQMLSGLKGTLGYLDDIIVASSTIQEHNSILVALFKRIQDFGLKIRLEKCKFLQPKIKFLGHIVTATGIHPDPARSDAIRKMPAPTDVSSLRSFLGAINYYGRFIKSMREIRGPLDELLRKDIKWEWTDKQQQAFDKAKKILLSDLLLTHYDPKLPIVVAADASKDGIGATISHIFPDKSEKVVEHASITFSSAQRNYSQIEKEALGLVFAVQKFHRMLYGRHFTLLTDHKPLLAIFGSKTGIPIYSASRLQRWALILSNYSFNIQYVKTAAFGKADVLSRLIAAYPRPEEDILIANICTETDLFINSTFANSVDALPVTAPEIANESSNDDVLSKVFKLVQNGWPTKCTDQEIAPFFPKRNEISEINGCLVYGNRTIIPTKLRSKILKALHFAHPGIVRMKAIAREHVYWPGLNSEIERLVRLCEACQEAAKKSPKSPLHPWEIPSEVFERIHTDFAGPCSDGSTYLLIVDSYSKWPEVFKMPNMSAAATVICMRSFVHRFGIPKEIVSDNGTQFRSAEFAQFCQEFGIKQTFIPPFHPQSNGQAERFVGTFKRSMKKCKEEGTDWVQKMLFAYRTTPNSALNGRSPDELFLGRNLRTKLSLVHPEQQEKKVSSSDHHRKEYTKKMANQFDAKHGTKFVTFSNGESVFLLNYRFGKTHWLPGKIIEQVKNSPTFRVEVPSLGRTVHRHANQLRRRLDDVSSPPAEVVIHMSPPRVASPPLVPAQQNIRSPRPKREVKPPRRLNFDSSKKRYEYE